MHASWHSHKFFEFCFFVSTLQNSWLARSRPFCGYLGRLSIHWPDERMDGHMMILECFSYIRTEPDWTVQKGKERKEKKEGKNKTKLTCPAGGFFKEPATEIR